MIDKTVMVKDLNPGDEFRRFSGKHRYVVSSQREEHGGDVRVLCYNLTNGNSYEWGGSKQVVPLKEGKGGHTIMGGDYKEVARVHLCLEKGGKYQVEMQGSDVVVSKEAERVPIWENITKSCVLEFRDSRHCEGRYIAIMHKDRGLLLPAAIVGMMGIQVQKGYKVEKPIGAYTSFRILKKQKGR